MSEQSDGIRPGTVVRLKEGLGPKKMIADGHVEPGEPARRVACYWFADGEVYQRADFRESDLEVVPK